MFEFIKYIFNKIRGKEKINFDVLDAQNLNWTQANFHLQNNRSITGFFIYLNSNKSEFIFSIIHEDGIYKCITPVDSLEMEKLGKKKNQVEIGIITLENIEIMISRMKEVEAKNSKEIKLYMIQM